MILYNDVLAPNPRRVRIFMAEKGIEMDVVNIDIMENAHKSETFSKISPLHRLPVLELDDGSHICETIAICGYLESLYPEPNLMGEDSREKAHITMRQRQIEMELFHRVAHAMRHCHPALARIEQPQIKEWGEANKPKAEKVMDWLDKLLSENAYVCGTRFTIADITLLCTLDFAKMARINVFEGRDHLKRWHETVCGRESATA